MTNGTLSISAVTLFFDSKTLKKNYLNYQVNYLPPPLKCGFCIQIEWEEGGGYIDLIIEVPAGFLCIKKNSRKSTHGIPHFLKKHYLLYAKFQGNIFQYALIQVLFGIGFGG